MRKDLCADGLVGLLSKNFEKVGDFRSSPQISMHDALMSGFAMFSLKSPSILALENQLLDPVELFNFKSLFHVEKVPSDTRMREILDNVSPKDLRGCFTDLFRAFQRGKCLENFVFFDEHYLLSVDGTGYFSSESVHCENCLVKKGKTKTSYHHQLLSGVLVHPELKQVLPICPEPIVKQDGESKNDCERNASERLLRQFRKEHPKLKVILLEDGLSSNGPHIKLLKELNMSFILSAKPGDHKALFEEFDLRSDRELYETEDDKFYHSFEFINDVSLNRAHQDLLINFLIYDQINKKTGKNTRFSWVSDITFTKDNVYKLMRGGRARWSIENETFNTLKNHGYHFEHNFGHGYNNLSTVFAMLMMLAFTVDQIQFYACSYMQKAKEKVRLYRNLWMEFQVHFRKLRLSSWTQLLMIVTGDVQLIYNST